MKVHLTEQAAEILLEQEEVQTLVKGEVVMGSPETAFLSPFGQRIVIVRPVKERKEPLYRRGRRQITKLAQA